MKYSSICHVIQCGVISTCICLALLKDRRFIELQLGFWRERVLVMLGRRRGKGKGWARALAWARVVKEGGVGLGPNQREKERERKEKKKRGGSVPSHVSHPRKEREKEREGKREAGIKREGNENELHVLKLGKVQMHKSWEKEKERWCDGGGDGVSTKNKRGECSPSSWRILETRVRVH